MHLTADKAAAVLLAHAHTWADDEADENDDNEEDDDEDKEGPASAVSEEWPRGLLPRAARLPLRSGLLGAALLACGAEKAHPAAPSDKLAGSQLGRHPSVQAVVALAGSGPALGQAEWAPLLRDQGLLGPKDAQVRFLLLLRTCQHREIVKKPKKKKVEEEE